jgi:hypothetical protein
MTWTRSYVRKSSSGAAVFAVAVAFLVAIATMLTGAGPAFGQPVAPAVTADGLVDLPAIKPAIDCGDLVGLDVSRVTGTTVSFTSATVVSAGAPKPYCEVRGTIAPASTVVMRLPVQGWTQRYVQTGCGGLCGQANISYPQAGTCPPVADGSVASATTDMGHQGQQDGSWAADNRQAVIDFSYRSVHLTAVVAKAVITAFYERQPAYAYFDGCSDGGREALMEAQRYPDDFDGIAAGAPANSIAVQNTVHHAWNVLANQDRNGRAILLAGKLPLVHQAVLTTCDSLDGVRDGLLTDPRTCHFNPASLICRSGQHPSTCLSKAEAGVVLRLHDGATDSHGRRLEPAIAHEWGSELDWTLFVPAAQGQTVFSEQIALSFLRYLAYPNQASPTLKLTDFQFTRSAFWKAVQSSSYMAATNPDLSQFWAAGGKLLIWHGWSDQHISPQSTLTYWDAMRRTMGGGTVDSFAKLYLFPGVAHCSGGEGPDTFDILTPVMAWAESGRQPDRIVTAKVVEGKTTRTRPVFPYPAVARYTGTGSTDSAANFVSSTPARSTGPGYSFVGSRLYSDSYQTWCRAEGTELVCRPRKTWLTAKVVDN